MDSDILSMYEGVRKNHPLVHHITNYVTVNDCANICICSGGSPVMTDDRNDVLDMVKIANALVINMGTLNERTVESMLLAGKFAKEHGVPVVFDAVGAGATGYRNDVASQIIREVRPDIIKGNSGEISFLAGVEGGVRGVDSTGSSEGAKGVIAALAGKHGCIVASTGKIDYVSDGKEVYELSNGDDYQGYVSGTGCMLSSVMGTYVGANGACLAAVIASITAFNIAAQHAAKDCKGPGSFKVSLMDRMFDLDPKDLAAEAKIRKL
jgi:hydroxyethylthiazole kinase